MPPDLYLDECVDVALAAAVERQGVRAVTTVAAGMLGASDEAQLCYAGDRGLVIVSHNRRHFRRLHRDFQAEGRTHAGIILLSRTTPLTRLTMRLTMLLAWIAISGDHQDRLFSWGMLQERFDRGDRLPGFSEEDVRLAIGR